MLLYECTAEHNGDGFGVLRDFLHIRISQIDFGLHSRHILLILFFYFTTDAVQMLVQSP